MRKIWIKISQDFAFSRFMMRGKKTNVIFFPGCAFLNLGYDLNYKVLNLLRKVYTDAEICSLCCSNPSQVLDNKYHMKNKTKLVNFFVKRETKIIYTACPNCFKMLNEIFKENDLSIKVLMIYDFISEEIDKVTEYHRINESVVLHDPCVMRNALETQNSVRNILNLIKQDFVEISNNRDKTACCGNNNMMHIVNPNHSALVRKKRVEELKEGASLICSYCNGCLNAFKKENIRVIHLLELVFGKAKSNTYLNRLKMTINLKRI